MITINKLRKLTLALITMIFCISFGVVAAISHAQSVVRSNAIKAPQQTQVSLTNTFHPEAGDFREIKAKLHKDNLIIDAGELSLDAAGVAIGTGGIVSTATDLTKWMQVLHKEKTVLNKKLYKLLVGKYTKTKGYGEKAEDTLFYGYGLFISNDSKSGSCIFHTGGIGSYRSLVKYNIDLDTYVVILSDIPEICSKINDVVFAD